MSVEARLNRLATRVFKRHNLFLRADAAKEVVNHVIAEMAVQTEHLGRIVTEQEVMETLVESIRQRRGTTTSLFVEASDVKPAAVAISRGLLATEEKDELVAAATSPGLDEALVQEVDAFRLQAFDFNTVNKSFAPNNNARPIHGVAADKARALQERYQCVEQRIRRNPLFAPPAIGRAKKDADSITITQIDSLLGQTGNKYIFGMLAELEEGKWFLEDSSTSIPLNLEHATATNGLLTDHSFVIVEGRMADGVFLVHTLGSPPAERREDTLTAHPSLDVFGLKLSANNTKRKKILDDILKSERKDDRIIIVADVHLDDDKTLGLLRKMFEGFAPSRPSMFVLIGPFFSQSFGSSRKDYAAVTAHFDKLADLIDDFPELVEHTTFALVPSLTDPGAPSILPRPALLSAFTAKLKERVPNLRLLSNPARVLYFGLELIFYRSDLLQKLRRNAVFPPHADSSTDLAEQLVNAVCDQAHLSPLPYLKQPVYWNYDHALRLNPLPQLLVLVDATEQFDFVVTGCRCVNPGSLAQDATFLVYYPASDKVDFSAIPK